MPGEVAGRTLRRGRGNRRCSATATTKAMKSPVDGRHTVTGQGPLIDVVEAKSSPHTVRCLQGDGSALDHGEGGHRFLLPPVCCSQLHGEQWPTMKLPSADLSDLDRFALIVVDVQRGFDDAEYWGPRNNPQCEDNIAALLAAWRDRSRPVVFVRHDSTEAPAPLRPGQPGNAFKPIVSGHPDLLVTKQVNSCFHGHPDLDGWLREQQLDGFVLSGITTNHCLRRLRE